MPRRTLLAIGEAMIEMSRAPDSSWSLGFAGDTFNTAWYARALLDPDRWNVEYYTRLGTDVYSDRMVRFMVSNAICTTRIQRDPGRQPGLYLIELEAGERSFTYWRNDSAARALADDLDALASAIAAADAVYVSGISLAILPPDRRSALIQMVAAATRRGALTAFDPNIRPVLWENAKASRDTIMRAAGSAAIALPSFSDEAPVFGDASPTATIARYRAEGCAEVVVKNGGEPTLLSSSNAIEPVAVEAVVEPVDTTGAGDAFNGGYLAARLLDRTPPDAAREGHRVADIVIRRDGAIVPQTDVANDKRASR